MVHSLEFDDFARRLYAGDDEAARELLTRYASQLMHLAARRISPQLRSKVDSDDVVQSVMRSFLRRVAHREIDLRNWSSLGALLTIMTIRRCSRQAAWHRADRRRASLEQPLELDGKQLVELISREPSPEAVATLADTIRYLLEQLDEQDRDIVQLSLAGESTADIAARVGCSQRTVQRTLFRVRQLYLLLDEQDDGTTLQSR